MNRSTVDIPFLSEALSGERICLILKVEDNTRVSNGTGQCNFSGQRDRSSFIVPGQRDNGTSSKSCHGTGRDGPGRDSQNPRRDAGQIGTEQKKKF